MKLTALDPRLYRTRDGLGLNKVSSVKDAQGLMFLCPACFVKNSGPTGTHMILVWFADRGVPDKVKPLPRWDVMGTSVEDITLSPSINLDAGQKGESCRWHGWVKRGEVT